MAIKGVSIFSRYLFLWELITPKGRKKCRLSKVVEATVDRHLEAPYRRDKELLDALDKEQAHTREVMVQVVEALNSLSDEVQIKRIEVSQAILHLPHTLHTDMHKKN